MLSTHGEVLTLFPFDSERFRQKLKIPVTVLNGSDTSYLSV